MFCAGAGFDMRNQVGGTLTARFRYMKFVANPRGVTFGIVAGVQIIWRGYALGRKRLVIFVTPTDLSILLVERLHPDLAQDFYRWYLPQPVGGLVGINLGQ